MNPFTEKSDEELQSYFADYEQLRSFNRDRPLSDPEFARLLSDYKSKCGPIGEMVLGQYLFEEIFHRWEKTLHNN